MKRTSDNFLDYVYKISDGLVQSTNDKGQVVVDMPNKGFANKIAQKFFKRPEVSHITLEGMGTFIFGCIDGTRDVGAIGRMVKEKFGEEAEPLYERLSVYMKKLEEVGFVERV